MKILRIVAAAFCILALIKGANLVHADENPTIRIAAGEMFEITADSESNETEYSWILSKDRKFQTAQRTRFFQTRIAEVGTYVLDVSVQNSVTGENAYRAFTIIVTEPNIALPTPPSEGASRTAVIETAPETVQGSIYLPPNGGVILIRSDKSRGTIDQYDVDLDLRKDSNGDGDPGNDVDNEGTFSRKTGSPLYVYFLPSDHERSVGLSVSATGDPNVSRAQVGIMFTSTPPAAGQTASVSGEPSKQRMTAGPIAFTARGADVDFETLEDENGDQAKQTLSLWDFGDRSTSLLTNPTHTYASPGTYTVTLTVQDISTAQILRQGSTTVAVQFEGGTPSSPSFSSVSSSTGSSKDTGSGAGTWKAILWVIIIIFFLLTLAGALFAVLSWLKNRTAMSIQKTLEKVEHSIVKKDEKESAEEPSTVAIRKPPITPDVTIKKETIVEKEKAKTDFKKDERGMAGSATASGPIPSWLKGENTSPVATKPMTTTAAKPPAPPPPSTPPKTMNAEPKTPAPSSASSGPEGPVPSWLKPQNQAMPPKPTSAPGSAPPPSPTPPKSHSPTLPPPKPMPPTTPRAAPPQMPPPAPKPPAPQIVTPPKSPSTPTPATAPKAESENLNKPQTPASSIPPSAPKPPMTTAMSKPTPPAPTPPPPAPKTEPKAVENSPAPTPPAPQKPVPPMTPVMPKSEEIKEVPKKNDDEDPPIAIIQADSLTK